VGNRNTNRERGVINTLNVNSTGTFNTAFHVSIKKYSSPNAVRCQHGVNMLNSNGHFFFLNNFLKSPNTPARCFGDAGTLSSPAGASRTPWSVGT
jgi:hypothetical protein